MVLPGEDGKIYVAPPKSANTSFGTGHRKCIASMIAPPCGASHLRSEFRGFRK